jgi:hypothetical protein
MVMYQGLVFDRLTGRLIYKSRLQMDYVTAHRLAEKRAKSARYTIVVDTMEVDL